MTFYRLGVEPSATGFPDDRVTTAVTYYQDGNFSRAALSLWGQTYYYIFLDSLLGDNDTTGWWVHFTYDYSTESEGYMDNPIFQFKDDLGNTAVQTVAHGSGYFGIRYYNYQTTTYTDRSYVFSSAKDVAYTYDVHGYKSGVDSVLEFYTEGVLACKITHTSENNPGIFQLGFRAAHDTGDRQGLSELIVADQDTRGLRVKTIPMTGNSATHTAWAGDYQDIDAYNDDSGIVSTSLNQIETFTHGGLLASQQGAGIAAIALQARMSGNGTNDIQGVLRKGGTDYVSADLGVTEGNLNNRAIWTSDPSTGGSWGNTDLTGVEFGFKSVT